MNCRRSSVAFILLTNDLLIAFEKNDQLNVWDEGFKGIYDKINQDLKESVKDLERMETISHFLKGAES